MVKSVTMVMSNKILSSGKRLDQTSGMKKEQEKETIKQPYYCRKTNSKANSYPNKTSKPKSFAKTMISLKP